MGTLASIALRLRELGSGQLSVVNLNERNLDLLSNLGLDQLFNMSSSSNGSMPVPNAPQEMLPPVAADKITQAETMLEAHEELVQANPANAAKFKDVLEYLKHDLHLSR